jgi:outer membrane protein TolC
MTRQGARWLKSGSLRLICAGAIALCGWLGSTRGDEGRLFLDKRKVAALVREKSPLVHVARSKASEVRAARTGAGALAPTNPDLSASAGLRHIAPGSDSFDFAVSLSWPFDISGTPGARSRLAERRVEVAEAEVTQVERIALSEALDLWTRARAAEERLALAQQRAGLDSELLRIAKVRRDAGTAGDGDVELAIVLLAEGQARLRTAEGEREAVLALLRGRLGLAAGVAVTLPNIGTVDTEDLPTVDELVASLESHPEVMRAAAGTRAARQDADLQHRLGMPVPKLLLIAEHSPEYTGRAGFDLPLPIYQRNQTNAAIADARAQTSALEETATRVSLEAELRAAYARFAGARAAYDELRRVGSAIDDAEHLATRGYELGQGTLMGAVTARREAVAARAALLDAKEALLRTRIAVTLAAGGLL